MTETVAVLGAGAWGTALAINLARNGHAVRLWGHTSDHVERLRELRENTDFMPGFRLDEKIDPRIELKDAIAGTRHLLIAIPSKGFRELLHQLKPLVGRECLIFWASKGFELETGRLLHELVEAEFPHNSCGVISGPSFAIEVARGLPTLITCAGTDPASSEMFAELLRGQHFRAYTTEDIIGVELGGALKNVLAIAVGAADGLGYGANTRAALITRGLNEMVRLATRMGARQETLMGLSGLGDLILTCTDDQSRNRRFGLAIGKGRNPRQAEIEVGHTVEGFRAARAVHDKVSELGLDLPIMDETYRVLYEGKHPRDAVRDLENRPQGHE
ncbi:MAG: NAD(P)H-dependent glycerol-3-phosphate dehydrogenase [Gammaproteobacteria bacterium]|nr:NAD(P)H-dependent glycerol-3-phosphate dehydrogenase [Gammaproteobacteria bacterium]